MIDGREEYTLYRLIKTHNSLNKLISSNQMFTYHDEWLTLDELMPKINNRIEDGVNASLRQLLREYRGMSLERRIKAIFWWCYMHSELPLNYADILKVMPTDKEIANIYNNPSKQEKLSGITPKWGDAIVWSDLHMIDYSHDAFRHD